MGAHTSNQKHQQLTIANCKRQHLQHHRFRWKLFWILNECISRLVHRQQHMESKHTWKQLLARNFIHMSNSHLIVVYFWVLDSSALILIELWLLCIVFCVNVNDVMFRFYFACNRRCSKLVTQRNSIVIRKNRWALIKHLYRTR